jgi:hypothetical protein
MFAIAPTVPAGSLTDFASIRPLETPEVRARTLCGRTQISENGQHLVDGVPFGRPYLRQPNRPPLAIPPRKRRRISDSDDTALGIVNGEPQLLLTNTDPEKTSDSHVSKRHKSNKSVHFAHTIDDSEDDDDEADDDFDPDAVGTDNDSSSEESDVLEEFQPDASGTKSDLENEENSDSESDSSDGSDSSEDTSDSSISDSSSSGDSSDTDSSSDSSSGSEGEETPTKAGAKSKASTQTSAKVPETRTVISKSSKISTEAPSDQNNLSADPLPIRSQTLVPPGEGSSATKKRNARRKLKMKILKEEHELQQHAEPDGNIVVNGDVTMPSANGSDLAETPVNASVDNKLTLRQTQLLESLESGSAEVGLTSGDHGVDTSTAEPPQKRLKLDIASSRRLLFGSLGIRNPKTKEDEQKLSEQLMSRYNRNAIPSEKQYGKGDNIDTNDAASQTAALNQDGAHQDHDWKQYITLSAVECVDEGVTLSTPPFPFQQKWDLQYRGKNHRHGNKKAARRSYGNSLENSYDESLDSVFYKGESSENPTTTAKRVKKHEANILDLPELPSHLDTLPDAKPADITTGAIIAFKQVECDGKTNYVPTVSDYRTARIDAVTGANEYDIVLALRDRQVNDAKFDHNGNRIWGRYEMPEEEDGDLDDGARHLSYHDLMVPKIVQAAPSTTAGAVNAFVETEGSGSIIADEVNSTTSSKTRKKKGKSTTKALGT